MSQNLIGNAPASTKPAEFKMPNVCLGMTVLWRPSPHGDACPGTVVRVGDDAIEVLCHVSGLLNHYARGGVRHKDDPWLLTHPMAEQQGCWDYIDERKVFDRFIASFGGSEE